MKDTFILKTKYKSVINKLSDKQAGVLFKMLFEYVENGANAGSTDDKVDMAFEFIKLDLDYYIDSYQKKVEANTENGKKGGNPNFVKGKSNPYYEKKDNPKITEDNPTLPNITEDNPIDIDIDIDNISFLEKKKQKSVCVDFGEEEKKEQPLNAEKETSPQVAPAPPPFNFKKAMLAEGFAPELVDEWLKIRKAKKAINSEIAFKTFIEQVRKTGQDKNAILEKVVQKQWKGFEASWLQADQSPQQATNNQIILDENGKIITNAEPYGQQSTVGKPPYFAGRQTLENIRNNSQGWGTHIVGDS